MARIDDDELHERYGDLGYEDGRFAQRRGRERAEREHAAGARPPGRFAGRGPQGYRRSDERLREEVCDRLMAEPEIDPGELTVSVADGEVTLAGFVADREMKRGAEACAESVLGVRHVNSRLRVAPSRGE
jgi:osmotically-inducible protein OsmY